MPAVNRGMFLQLSLLLLIVPAQYFLTQWKPTTSTQRSVDLQQLVTKMESWQDKITNPDWWQKRGRKAWNVVNEFFNHFGKYGEEVVYGSPMDDDDDDDSDENPDGESPALEVLQYRETMGYFGGSTEKRSPRARQVKFRIGQVVRHKKMGYRGVVVGWDQSIKAPQEWIHEHIPLDKRHYINQPNYLVLVNKGDKQSFSTAYVAQELLDVNTNKIEHPQIEEYFEAYDGSRYLARPWLKKVYPHDQ